MKLVLVFIGGGLGAVCRWLIGVNLTSGSAFPLATFSVNMLGCFLFGLIAYSALKENSTVQLLVLTGFLGGFTTFSSFGYEMFHLFKSNATKTLLTYALLSNFAGLGLVFVGYKIASIFS